MNKKEAKNKSNISWDFLLLVLLAYVVFFVFKQKIFFSAISYAGGLFLDIFFTFLAIFVLMVLVDYFITPQFIIKHFGGNNILKWFFVIIGGILSSGPIYMWYPLMADLRGGVLNNGMVACFLYNRAIKIPLLPMAIVYFGWSFVVVLFFTTIIMSLLQGYLINKIVKNNPN